MDSENKILMVVDTGNSKKTISDLKNEIKQLKNTLDEAVVGSEEAKKASQSLADAQNQLKAAMNGAVTETGKLDNSYNGLVARMAQLKSEQHKLNLATEQGKASWASYAKKINEINNKLKELDASNGVFGRNVGNYMNDITLAMTSMGYGATNLARGFTLLTRGVNSFNIILKSLVKNPVLIFLAGLVTAVYSLYNAFQKNEEALLKLKEAWSPIAGLGNALFNVITDTTDAIGNGLARAITSTTNLLQRMFQHSTNKDFIKRMTEAQEIEKEKQKLEKDRINMIRTEADYEKELNRLRSLYKRYMKDDERAMQYALAIEENRKELLARKIELAQRAYDLKVKENAQTKSGNKDIEEENRLYAELVELQSQIGVHSDEYSAKPETQLEAVKTQMAGILVEQEKIEEQALISAERIVETEESLKNKYLTDSKRIELIERKNFYEKQLKDYAKHNEDLRKEYEKYGEEVQNIEAEIAKNNADERKKEFDKVLEQRKALEKKLEEWSMTELERLKAQYDADLKLLGKNNEKKLILDQKYAVDKAKILAEAARKWAEAEMQNAGDTSGRVNYENVSFNELKANHKLTEDEEYEHQRRLLEIQKWGLEERQRILQDNIINSEAFHNLTLDDQRKYLEEFEKLTEQISLVNSQLSASDAENARRRIETAKQERQMKADAYISMANAIGDIFTSIADTMDENNEKQFEAAKAFNIAGATVNTIAGAIDAYMGAVGNTGLNAIPVVGPAIAMAMGIANAAAVTAAGVANITKIARQKYKGGDSASNAKADFSASSASIAAVNAPVQYTSAVEGASINDSITHSRVYVLESDIQDTTAKVNVQESENRY